MNLLVVLDALFAERGVTKAGERLYLSQSATSAALGRLRAYFEDELLIQNGHRMTLTPYAEDLVEPLRDVLLRAEAITKHNSRFDPASAVRTFRLKMSDYVASIMMPEVLSGVRRAAPGITFDIQSNFEAPQAALEQGDVDLLILPDQYLSGTHPYEKLFEDNYVCAVWSGNKQVGDRLSIAEYLSMGHAAVKFPNQANPVLEEWFASQFGQRRRIEVLVMAFTLLPQLIVGTDLIATMHERLAAGYAKTFPLRLVPTPMRIPKLSQSMQWHRHRDLDPGIVWLRRILAATFAGGRTAL